MDKVEIFLTKQQRWLSWLIWKISIFGRPFWKGEYLRHSASLTSKENQDG